MKYISVRDLQLYLTSLESRSRMNTLDRLVGVAYRKMTWWKSTKGREEGFTLRYIDLEKAINYLEEYLIVHKDNKLYAVVRGVKSKKVLLKVLIKLRDKQ